MKTIWSVHDVMPQTLSRTREILQVLAEHSINRVTLLVIPNRPWTDADLAALHAWQSQGYQLAAHGWNHLSGTPVGVFHICHSQFFSRDAAEHLGKTAREVLSVINRSSAWFREVGLGCPDIYVPPAWALGETKLETVHAAGFRYIETIAGIHETLYGRFVPMPIVGFQASNAGEAVALRFSNAVNWFFGASSGQPVRVAIHPDDFNLLLHGDLARALRCRSTVVTLQFISGLKGDQLKRRSGN